MTAPAPPNDDTLRLRAAARFDGAVPVLTAVPETAGRPLAAADRGLLLAALLVAGFDPVDVADPASLRRLPDPPGWEVLVDVRGDLRLRDPDGATMGIGTGPVPDGWYSALLTHARLVLLVTSGTDGVGRDGTWAVAAARPVGASLPVVVHPA